MAATTSGACLSSDRCDIDWHHQQNRANQSLIASCARLNQIRIARLLLPTPEEAAVQIERWAWYYVREAYKQTESTATG